MLHQSGECKLAALSLSGPLVLLWFYTGFLFWFRFRSNVLWANQRARELISFMRLTVVCELLRALFLLFLKLGTSMFCLLLWNRKQEFFSGLVAKLTALLTKYKSGCQTDSTTNQLCLLRMRALCEFNNSFVVFFNNSVKWRHWSDSHAKSPTIATRFILDSSLLLGGCPAKKIKKLFWCSVFANKSSFYANFWLRQNVIFFRIWEKL